jgi:predicted DNA-binding transcriptional regulator AlpA
MTQQNQLTPGERYFTLQEFMKLMQLSYTAYRTLRAKGLTPPEIRISTRTIRFSESSVREWATKMSREMSSGD